MQPQTLNCPMCGASLRGTGPRCQHCGARLATVACPHCFGMMFTGTKFCPRCGTEASRTEAGPEPHPGYSCPRCAVLMSSVGVGDTTLCECSKCDGLWVDKDAFERLCADREKQAPLLGRASLARDAKPDAPAQIRYVPCPRCGKLMNRVNFASCSGVIVDVCREHGTWFDRDELSRIIEFMRSGGMNLARDRQKAELMEQEQRLRRVQQRRALDHGEPEIFRSSAVVAAGDLLRRFLR